MKRTLLCIFLLAVPVLSAQTHTQQQGTIVRMRMTNCLGPQHGFMATMSGDPKAETGLLCPEYVLVADKVVYVIGGKPLSNSFPLRKKRAFACTRMRC